MLVYLQSRDPESCDKNWVETEAWHSCRSDRELVNKGVQTKIESIANFSLSLLEEFHHFKTC